MDERDVSTLRQNIWPRGRPETVSVRDNELLPVDRIAARVTGKGDNWTPETMAFAVEWEERPSLKPCPSNLKDLTGSRRGRVEIVGYFGSQSLRKCKHKWVGRCDCGKFVLRNDVSWQRGLFANTPDVGCRRCSRLEQLQHWSNTDAGIRVRRPDRMHPDKKRHRLESQLRTPGMQEWENRPQCMEPPNSIEDLRGQSRGQVTIVGYLGLGDEMNRQIRQRLRYEDGTLCSSSGKSRSSGNAINRHRWLGLCACGRFVLRVGMTWRKGMRSERSDTGCNACSRRHSHSLGWEGYSSSKQHPKRIRGEQ